MPGTLRHLHLASLRLLLLATLLFASVAARGDELPKGDPRAAGFSPERLGEIEKAIAAAVEKRQIAGASALVLHDGKVIYRTNVGRRDVEHNLSIENDTIFRIASMSKPSTSAAIMILVDDGKLSVDDPLSEFIPEFAEMKVLVPRKSDDPSAGYDTVPATRPITIHHLLTHTSGITYSFLNRPPYAGLYANAGVIDGLIETEGTMADNAARLAKLPLLFQPGERWEYGLNTDLLGRVVEVASGKTLEEFLAERIFRPLGMNDTSFQLPKSKHDRLAALYTRNEDNTIRRVGSEAVKANGLAFTATLPLQENYIYYSGGAGLVSTADDYARFLQALLNGGVLDGQRILKRETVERMTTNRLNDLSIGFPPGASFGYGFGIVTEASKKSAGDQQPASIGTYSWGGAFYTQFFVDPKEKLIGVFLTQMLPNDHLKLHGEFTRLIYAAKNRN